MPTITKERRDAFWARVDRSGGGDSCWPWLGASTGNYPAFGVGGGRVVYGHRVAYVLARGPIPDGLLVLHNCRREAVGSMCVNPRHLRVGTNHDNARDRVAHRGR